MQLQASLRNIVEQMRQGSTIVPGEVVATLRSELHDAGWKTPHSTGQEDVGELFLFLLHVFDAPAFPILKTIYHGGEQDEEGYDGNVSAERIITLPLWPTEDTLQLEDLLVDYFFSTKVERERGVKGGGGSGTPALDSPRVANKRAHGTPSRTPKVMVDAWQFQKILPFQTSDKELWESSMMAAAKGATAQDHHLVFPILLKRYTHDGARISTKVIIPSEVLITRFVADLTPNSGKEYALKLKSCVAHIGNSPQSGHYVCLASSSPDSSTWIFFDDLGSTPSFRYESFSSSSPYHTYPGPAAASSTTPVGRVQTLTDLRDIMNAFEFISRNAYLLFYELEARDLTSPTATSNHQSAALQMQAEEFEGGNSNDTLNFAGGSSSKTSSSLLSSSNCVVQ